jgi:3-hydroxybutyrate dehydrogenase
VQRDLPRLHARAAGGKQIQDLARRHHISPEEIVGKIMLEPAAIKRLLESVEVAAMAVYLCSDAAAGITGAALGIDPGWTSG